MLFCLASTGNAEANDRDRLRLQELQSLSEQSTDPVTQVQIANDVVEIYKRYRGQEGSDAAKETELNAKVEDFESKFELVEGVPRQGGFFDFIIGTFAGSTKKKGDNLVKSSTKTVVNGLTNYLLNKFWKRINLAK